MLRIGVDYDFSAQPGQWSYRGPGGARHGLPHPALRGAVQLGNAATALTALDALRDRLPLSMGAVREALVDIELPGRFQVLPGMRLNSCQDTKSTGSGARRTSQRPFWAVVATS